MNVLLCESVGEDGILFRYGKGNPCVNPINISHNREEKRTLSFVVSLLNQAKAITVSVSTIAYFNPLHNLKTAVLSLAVNS